MSGPFRAILISAGPDWHRHAVRCFLDIVREHGQSADLIMFPGWTLSPWQFARIKPQLHAVLGARARVVWEVGVPVKNIDKKGIPVLKGKGLGTLYSNQSGRLTCHGQQIFVVSSDLDGQRLLMDAVDSGDQNRWVSIGGLEFFWLNCGEVLLLNSPMNSDTAEPRKHAADWFSRIYDRATGFLNPGHTLFARTFITEKQARYLSLDRRTYLRTVAHRNELTACAESHMLGLHDGRQKMKHLPNRSEGPYLLGEVVIPRSRMRK